MKLKTDRQANRQTDRCFPDSNSQVGFAKLTASFCKQPASGTVVTIDQNAQWLRTTLPVNQSQDQTDTDMYSKLAKKTYHFNSRHDGLVDDVTVG